MELLDYKYHMNPRTVWISLSTYTLIPRQLPKTHAWNHLSSCCCCCKIRNCVCACVCVRGGGQQSLGLQMTALKQTHTLCLQSVFKPFQYSPQSFKDMIVYTLCSLNIYKLANTPARICQYCVIIYTHTRRVWYKVNVCGS